MKKLSCEVAVIGAGLSGLTSAFYIHNNSQSVLILEAQNRVGGRLLDHALDAATHIELGGMWLGPCHPNLMELITKLNIPLYKALRPGKMIFEFNHQFYPSTGLIPLLPKRYQGEAEQIFSQINAHAIKLNSTRHWEHNQASLWDKMTCSSWFDQNIKSKLVKAFFYQLATMFVGTEPEHFSFLHFLFHLRSCTDFHTAVKEKEGPLEFRIDGGSQNLTKVLADHLKNKIFLNNPVRKITQNSSRCIIDTDHLQITCKKIIIAIPPHQINGIKFNPDLSVHRKQLYQRLPMGNCVKSIMVYKEPFWFKQNLNGNILSLSTPVHSIWDATPPNEEYGILMAFFEGREARKFGRLTQQEREKLILEHFIYFFGKKAKNYLQYIEKDWQHEKWIQGAYSAYFPPGVWTEFGYLLRTPEQHIHWAGTETSSHWFGYMEGAVHSGKRATQEILKNI